MRASDLETGWPPSSCAAYAGSVTRVGAGVRIISSPIADKPILFSPVGEALSLGRKQRGGVQTRYRQQTSSIPMDMRFMTVSSERMINRRRG